MKKIFALALLVCLTSVSFGQRWSNPPGDNTGRQLTFHDYSVTFGGRDSVNPGNARTFYTVATLTHADTVYIKTTNAKKWDEVTFKFTGDTLTAGRIITFKPTSGGVTKVWTTTTGNTITVKKSKSLNITFIFDGTLWAEETRSIQF